MKFHTPVQLELAQGVQKGRRSPANGMSLCFVCKASWRISAWFIIINSLLIDLEPTSRAHRQGHPSELSSNNTMKGGKRERERCYMSNSDVDEVQSQVRVGCVTSRKGRKNSQRQLTVL